MSTLLDHDTLDQLARIARRIFGAEKSMTDRELAFCTIAIDHRNLQVRACVLATGEIYHWDAARDLWVR